MKAKFNMKDLVEDIAHTEDAPDINISRIKKLTNEKIKREKYGRLYHFRKYFIRVACASLIIISLSSVSIYVSGNESFREYISGIMGMDQVNVLVVGDFVKNKDYKLTVHEIATDTYLGTVVISIEALSNSSKEGFDNYSATNLEHINAGYGMRELEDYREDYKKYYEIVFEGARYETPEKKNVLSFSLEGMKKSVDIELEATVEYLDQQLPEEQTSDYSTVFQKIHLSELGLTMEGTDADENSTGANLVVEIIFIDGTRELLLRYFSSYEEALGVESTGAASEGEKSKVEEQTAVSEAGQESEATTESEAGLDNEDYSNLVQGWSVGVNSQNTVRKVTASISFSKKIPLNSISQIVINGIVYEIR